MIVFVSRFLLLFVFVFFVVVACRGGSEDDWVAMDALVDGGQLVVFVGEELEDIGNELGLCIRR